MFQIGHNCVLHSGPRKLSPVPMLERATKFMRQIGVDNLGSMETGPLRIIAGPE